MIAGSLLMTLQHMEFTRDLELRHLEKLASMATEIAFVEDEVLFREGDTGEKIYLIQEGLVAVEIHVPCRGQVSILTVGPGELLGWSSMFPGQRKTANGRAVTSGRAVAINATQLWEACQTDHDLGFATMSRVAELVAERLKATRQQLLDIFAPG